MEERAYPFNLLTDYFLNENHIDTSKEYVIESVPAVTLLCPNRFDLMAKWIYIDAREKCCDILWARNLYEDNIRAYSCGTFLEPGTVKKNSFEKYIEEFEKIIESMKSDGFDDTKSVIPVGEHDTILDGAHRTAAAAYYKKDVTIIRFPHLSREHDYRYFRNLLMTDTHTSLMARYYAHLKKNCYMACVWPVAAAKSQAGTEEVLRRAGRVVYERDIYLTWNGMHKFMVQIYGKQKWVGGIEDGYQGARLKAKACYKRGIPVKTYLFEAESLETVQKAKNEIRSMFGLGNHSIHISDTQDETEEMAELLYNQNSLYVLNRAKTYLYKHVNCELDKIRRWIKENGLSLDRFIIDSGAVLEVCGMRQASDIDCLTDYEEIPANAFFDDHKSQLVFYDCSVKDLLYNPYYYFSFEGIKFVSIEKIMIMKKRRREQKDAADVSLCRKFLKQSPEIPLKYRQTTHEQINQYQKRKRDYGHGTYTLSEYRRKRLTDILKLPYRIVRRTGRSICARWRILYIKMKRLRLKNTDISIISSNCNGGVIASDLGLPFRSPFVNLFIKADDFIKMLGDLKGYMSADLVFVKEIDSVYGAVRWPTAYLKDIKIHFMHYETEREAGDAWKRRVKRINYDNLFIIFTDRSDCTQKDLEEFDRLPYKNKIVFTHLPHPEIKSSYYIKGYEGDEKVGVLSEMQRGIHSWKRQLDQFDFVKWFNDGRS